MQKADLTWSGATGSVDVYRDDVMMTTASGSSYTDNIDARGGGSYSYRVCAAGPSLAYSSASRHAAREAVELAIEMYGLDHPDVALAKTTLASVLMGKGAHEEAEAMLREAAAIYLGVNDEFSSLPSRLSGLAFPLREYDRDLAGQLFERALAISRETNGKEHATTASAMEDLAHLRVDQGRDEDAEALFREALAVSRGTYGMEHRRTIQAQINLAMHLHRRMNRYSESEGLLKEALAIQQRHGDRQREVNWTLATLGRFLTDEGRVSEARPYLLKAISLTESGDDPRGVAYAKAEYAVLLGRTGEYRAGEAALLEALSLLPPEATLDRLRKHIFENAVAFYADWGKPDRADEYRRLLEEVVTQ